MPEYDARCPTCGHRTTLVKPMTALWPQLACEACGQAPLERVYHPISAIYLAEGFFTSDNRSEIEKYRFKHLWQD